jgi:microcystin-dependent protein|tara:strand:+ start:565 stop:1350 length:786 start_codon:yes stop_codon:yes gene_type:complete
MAVLQTGQSFSSGDQVTATKLQDIANLATFRTGTNQTADDSTIQVDGSGGYLKVKSAGISSNELATDSVITAKIQDGAVTAAKLDSAAVSVLMPTSTILPYAGSSAPTGYLLCDGAAISRTTYSDLFGLVGTTYGVGDGSTTFNIPDLRGRVIAGQDDMGGSSANRLTNQSGGLNGDTLGATGGTETHTLSTSEIPAHDHDITTTSKSNNTNGVAGNFPTGTNQNPPNTTAPNTEAVQNTGGGNAHNNVQPTIILNYIIKT